MKTNAQLFKFFFAAALGGMCILGCTPDDPEADPGTEPPTGADTLTVADLDSFSDRLQFIGATKKPGKSPAAPGVSSLKISIKDTLHLVQGVLIPIRFLHENITDNVAGIYVQVVSMAGGGGLATNFYDVPEHPELAVNDSLSVIIVGFDQAGLGNPGGVPPAGGAPPTFDVTITPYNESGQPLDEITVPVSVEELNDNPKGENDSGKCGLVIGPDEVWEWEMSYILNPQATSEEDIFSFYADPFKIFGAEGQHINGCCVDGVTDYSTLVCPPNTPNHRILRFPTFYHRQSELLTFFDNGTYLRQTFEKVASAEPEISDFCGSGPGIVKRRIIHGVTNGNWTIKNINVPPSMKAYYNTRNRLTLQTTSSTGGGSFTNSGGFVHQLNCKYMVLAQPDNEGDSQIIYKFYNRQSTLDPDWYPTH